MIGYLARKGFSRLAHLQLIQTKNIIMKLVVPNVVESRWNCVQRQTLISLGLSKFFKFFFLGTKRNEKEE